MSNQIPGKNCAAHSLERMSASLNPQGHPNKRMGDRRCRLRAADRQLVIYKSGLWSRFGRSAHPPKNNPPQHSFFTARR
jgi:hypothetical protein